MYRISWKMLSLALVLCLPISSVFGCDSTLPDGTHCPDIGFESLPDPTDCSRFYQCSNGCAQNMQCPNDFLYDADNSWCAGVDEVDCGDRPNPAVSSTESPATTSSVEEATSEPCDGSLPDNQTCPGEGFSSYPDPEDCSRFYQCSHGCSKNLKCPNDFLYDADNSWCAGVDEVDCGDRPNLAASSTESPATTSSIEEPTSEPCDGSLPDNQTCPEEGFSSYPDPEDCSRFYQCSHGCSKNLKCPNDFLYDADNFWCAGVDEVDCGDRPNLAASSTESPATTSSLPATTTEYDCGHLLDCTNLSDGWYPDPYNCKKYWNCDNGRGKHYMCDTGLYYKSEKNWCDYPENVDCGERPVCNECDEDCEATHCTEYCREWYGDFAMGCCSNQYCRCEAGTGWIMKCQPNLVFVESRDWCDYRSSVACCSNPTIFH